MVNLKKVISKVLPDRKKKGTKKNTNDDQTSEKVDTVNSQETESSLVIEQKDNSRKSLPEIKESFQTDKPINAIEETEIHNDEDIEYEQNSNAEEDSDEDDESNLVAAFEFENKDDKDFACLSPQQIISQQEKEIKAVADLFNIPHNTAGLMLRHYQWKKEKLIQKFFENPDAVYKEAGVTFDPSTVNSISKAIEISGEEMCSICSEDVAAENCTALSCGHRFCNDCWKPYLSTKIKDGETKLTCPHVKCNVVLDESTVKKLVDYETYDRYIRFVTKSFVEDSGGSIKWCPRPNCGNAITAEMIVGTVVKCTCGYRFCFQCHREAHAPALCEQVKQWDRKCKDDSETEHWKYANTKDCPKCETSVEKNGGCNHMTCRQCKHEWCWVCMRPWKGHNDYYTCNKFIKKEKTRKSFIFFGGSKKDKAREKEEERERNRVALERYLHCYERYANHSHSGELEKQIRTRAMSKVAELQKEANTAYEVQYVLDGTEVLLESRNVLKYTYVYGYYSVPETVDDKVTLFEFLQMDLEKTTELLSEVLESTDTSQDHRVRALTLIQLVKTKKTNLLKGIEEGLTTAKE